MSLTFNHNNKLFVNNSNVGIGTTSPFKKLDLGATSSETDIALNYSDVGTNLGQIGFGQGAQGFGNADWIHFNAIDNKIAKKIIQNIVKNYPKLTVILVTHSKVLANLSKKIYALRDKKLRLSSE